MEYDRNPGAGAGSATAQYNPYFDHNNNNNNNNNFLSNQSHSQAMGHFPQQDGHDTSNAHAYVPQHEQGDGHPISSGPHGAYHGNMQNDAAMSNNVNRGEQRGVPFYADAGMNDLGNPYPATINNQGYHYGQGYPGYGPPHQQPPAPLHPMAQHSVPQVHHHLQSPPNMPGNAFPPIQPLIVVNNANSACPEAHCAARVSASHENHSPTFEAKPHTEDIDGDRTAQMLRKKRKVAALRVAFLVLAILGIIVTAAALGTIANVKDNLDRVNAFLVVFAVVVFICILMSLCHSFAAPFGIAGSLLLAFAVASLGFFGWAVYNGQSTKPSKPERDIVRYTAAWIVFVYSMILSILQFCMAHTAVQLAGLRR